jgi:hypothetical protein
MNYKDAPNKVVDNFFTEGEIKRIYDTVQNTDRTDFQQHLSYVSWHIELPQDIVDKVTKIAEDIVGEGLVLAEYNFSRYQKTISDCKKLWFNPLLFPHIDDAFDGRRFTVDVQLKSNVDWDIVVDNWKSEQTFKLNDNQALTFSGTHQVHWRPKKEFKDEEFLEALFLHFVPKFNNFKSKEEKEEILSKRDYQYNVWEQTLGISSNPTEGSY